MLFLLTISLLLAGTQAKYYTDCGTKVGKVQRFSLSGCTQNDKICILKRNSNLTVEVNFTPTTEIKDMHLIVHGIVLNLPVPFPVPQPDVCKNSGLVCPLKSGEPAFYRSYMPVLKTYPKVKVDVRWEIQTSEGDVVCILLTCKIK